MRLHHLRSLRISAAAGLVLALAAWPLQVHSLRGQTYEPLSQYAIFYNGLLEFSTCSTMFINGPVYADGNIYAGTSASLTFNDTVTCTGGISSPAWNGQGPNWAATGTFNGVPPYTTNAAAILLPMEANTQHGLIDLPSAGESPLSFPGEARLYNQAMTVLLVSNTTVAMKLQDSINSQLPGADPAPLWLACANTPSALASTFPFLCTTNLFTDQRENRTVLTSQIDVGKYGQWIKTNAALQAKFSRYIYPLILYVADLRTTNSTQLTGVRLINGVAPPVNGGLGWTVVTPGPLYVLGHYNCTNSSALGTTTTTTALPCAFMSDALTILSPAWKDSLSRSPYTSRAASDTTINAAIVTGTVPSTGSGATQFSGGIHNLPRLLEDWSSHSLWLNTAILRLFDSQIATRQFVDPGVYYDPPTRHFNYDLNFQDLRRTPPGTPVVQVPTPPVITSPLQGLNLPVGSNATLTLSVEGDGLWFYWYFNRTNRLALTFSPAFTITNAQPSNAGTYSVLVSNPDSGGVTNSVATVTVGWPPSLTQPPLGAAVPLGTAFALSTDSAGTPPLSFQWCKSTGPIPGATNATLTFSSIESADAETYSVLVTNLYGAVQSALVSVSVFEPVHLTTPCVATNALWGRSASFSAAASGTGPLSYQWYKDGLVIPAATNPTLAFAPIQLGDGGLYSVVVSNAYGSVTSAAPLAVASAGVSLGLYTGAMLDGVPDPGVQAGLLIEGTPSYTYEVQCATDLAARNPWMSLTNLTLSEPQQLWLDTGTNAALAPCRFYRVLPGQ